MGETHKAIDGWERAYAGFLRRPDPVQAVVAAVTLSLLPPSQPQEPDRVGGVGGTGGKARRPLGVPVLDAWVLLARINDQPGPFRSTVCDHFCPMGDGGHADRVNRQSPGTCLSTYLD